MRLPRYLDIDLSAGTVMPYPISEEIFRKYVGGKILAARIMLAETRPGIDPFEPENIIVVNTGPLTATGVPSSGRFNITTKNVLTGGIGTSNCGGNFGIKLRRAGIDGLIIRGRARQPVYIEVTGGNGHIHQAGHLWGLDTEAVQTKLPGEYGKIVIGPAGENLVRYACALSQERVAGRCGAGAVMGSKNLKAIIAFGAAQVAVANPPALAKLTKKWTAALRANAMTGEALPKYGTVGFLAKGYKAGFVPVKNFSQPQFDQAHEFTGEGYARDLLTRNTGCVGCPIRCGRKQMEGEKEIKGPEYETAGLLGPNLLNASFKQVGHWNYLADRLGLDTISLGGTLGFAMELKERGLADLGVDFADLDSIPQIIEDIALRRGHGDELANGSAWLAKKYGGLDFAPQVKGMEMAAYDPRRSVGLGLGYATSNRGACHLNGGYMIFLEVMGPMSINPQSPRSKPALTMMMQNLMEAISASGVCLFTSMAVFPNALYNMAPGSRMRRLISRIMSRSGRVVQLLNSRPRLAAINLSLIPYPQALALATGMNMNLGRFLELGERGYNLERLYNLREGLRGKDELPKRMVSEPQDPQRPETIVPLAAMLGGYYRCRGWNEEGAPTAKKLKQLGIETLGTEPSVPLV
ncbi:MAG: aldehyde ferredoxin oxidoreductase family protein [Eubacteriales bacterium]|nr:aldehyde ferredoxin oxidoreductase family protein [Eubacteriales bacterium]